jgi:Protein of unknown function (DUF3592)
MLSFFGVIFLLLAALAGGHVAIEAHKIQILKDWGIDTAATVTDLYIGKRKGQGYTVEYRYTSDSSNTARINRVAVTKDIYNRLQIGVQIPVTYDPRDSNLSRLNFSNSIHQDDAILSAIDSDRSVNLILGALLLFIIGVDVFIFRQFLTEKRLLQWGAVAPAIILGEEEYKTINNRRFSKVRYSFSDTHASVAEGVNKYVPVAGDTRPALMELRAQLLQNPIVLFDPYDSSTYVLYPPFSVELA